MFSELHPVHYLPLLTTLLSTVFFFILMKRYKERGGTHHLVWALGIATYGLGTLLESLVTLTGNTVLLTKLWYVAGAILGGYPLAQGSVYLHLKKKTADLLSWITVPFIIIASVLVMLSPVDVSLLQPHRPSGAILQWQWVRLLTPIINLYAVAFLIGSAIMSAVNYAQKKGMGHRAIGNALIAFGALLPGIGGGYAKAGFVEALYIGECVGLMFIWLGYRYCVYQPPTTAS